jgi:hypothetical protein
MVHRIVTSKYYKASLIEVQKHWSIPDVYNALAVLDYYQAIEEKMVKKTKR